MRTNGEFRDGSGVPRARKRCHKRQPKRNRIVGARPGVLVGEALRLETPKVLGSDFHRKAVHRLFQDRPDDLDSEPRLRLEIEDSSEAPTSQSPRASRPLSGAPLKRRGVVGQFEMDRYC